MPTEKGLVEALLTARGVREKGALKSLAVLLLLLQNFILFFLKRDDAFTYYLKRFFN